MKVRRYMYNPLSKLVRRIIGIMKNRHFITWGGILVPTAVGFAYVAVETSAPQGLFIVVSIICFLLGLYYITKGLELAGIEDKKREQKETRNSQILEVIANKMGVNIDDIGRKKPKRK